jgi:CRP-like cAMP-binding protein
LSIFILPRGGPPDCDFCARRNECLIVRLRDRKVPLLVRQRNFKAGDRLLVEGEFASSVSVVKLGNVIVYRMGLDGCARPIALNGPPTVGVHGFLGQRNQVSVASVSAGRLCEVSMDDLKPYSLRGEFTDLAMVGFRKIAAWSELMRLPGVVKQLSYMLLLLSSMQSAKVIELPNQSVLAELLGTTRETAGRALAVLKKEGGIRRLERKKFEVFGGVLMKQLSRRAGRGAPSLSACD